MPKKHVPQLAVILISISSLTGVSPASGIGGDDQDEARTLQLRVDPFAAPLTEGDSGMPVYIAHSAETRVDGGGSGPLTERVVSNTVSIPRSSWGGPISDQWNSDLRLVYGPDPIRNPLNETYADHYYVWSGMAEGREVAAGDQMSHQTLMLGDMDTNAVPPEPTGREGQLAWKWLPEWRRQVSGISRLHPQTGGATAPVRAGMRSTMYINHAQLFAEGGDVDTAGGAIPIPEFSFEQAVPPATVMDFQVVFFDGDGPWINHLQMDAEYADPEPSTEEGTWKVRLHGTLGQGASWPEQKDVPGLASPQYIRGVTLVGVPVQEEQAPSPGILLETDLDEGERRVALVAARDGDGALHTNRMVFDQPGHREWLLTHNARLKALPSSDLSSASEAAAPTPSSGDVPIGEIGGPASARFSVNAEGRPVVHDVILDGKALVDRYDVRRVLTEDGPVELGSWNRHGRVVITDNQVRAVYLLDDLFVQVIFDLTSSSVYLGGSAQLGAYISSHSLDGEPHSYTIEGIADLGPDGHVDDRATGLVDRTTRFRFTEPGVNRLELVSGDEHFLVVAAGHNGFAGKYEDMNIELRNRGRVPMGEPLTDPEIITRVTGPPVWSYGLYASLSISHVDEANDRPFPPIAGRFTSVTTARPAAVAWEDDGGLGFPTLPLEETRDFDGNEPIAVLFEAELDDGTPITRFDLYSIFVDLHTLDGRPIWNGSAGANVFTPDADGTRFGFVITPEEEVDPADVHVWARGYSKYGWITLRTSQVPLAERLFRIDRAPLTVTGTDGGVIEGQTAPSSDVTVAVPELALSQTVEALPTGDYRAVLDLSGVPSGEYEVTLRSVTPGPEDDPARALIGPTPGDADPDQEVGTATARLRLIDGGDDAASHQSGPEADVAGAVAFLHDHVSDGAYGGSLRSTVWAVRGLRRHGAHTSNDTVSYLTSLRRPDGYGWRPGDPANATASGMAQVALAELGQTAAVDPYRFLRWDGGAEAAPGADVSSIEATAWLTMGMEAQGELDALDPRWRDKLREYLVGAEPRTVTEGFLRALALDSLGEATTASLDGEEIDALAYRFMIAPGNRGDLASYQMGSGGFSWRAMGDRAEVLPTALALAALAGAT